MKKMNSIITVFKYLNFTLIQLNVRLYTNNPIQVYP